jgi:hypothetical protein
MGTPEKEKRRKKKMKKQTLVFLSGLRKAFTGEG